MLSKAYFRIRFFLFESDFLFESVFFSRHLGRDIDKAYQPSRFKKVCDIRLRPNYARTDPFLGRTGLILGVYGVVFHGEYARDVR